MLGSPGAISDSRRRVARRRVVDIARFTHPHRNLAASRVYRGEYWTVNDFSFERRREGAGFLSCYVAVKKESQKKDYGIGCFSARSEKHTYQIIS